jgi:hypothetical protein
MLKRKERRERGKYTRTQLKTERKEERVRTRESKIKDIVE